MIQQIGGWVLRAACREAGSWPAAATVAVNVSAIQIHWAGVLDSSTRLAG